MKLGTDWLFIGLGLGAIYLVYKGTAPVTKALDSASGLVGSAAGLGSNVLDSLSSGVTAIAQNDPFTLSPSSGGNPVSIKDWLFKSPLVTIPSEVGYFMNQFASTPASQQTSNPINYSPAINPATTRAKTNIAASQGIVSVAPPQMSLAPKAKISPFTGGAYLGK